MSINSVNNLNANILNNTFNTSKNQTNPINNLVSQALNQNQQNQSLSKQDLLAGVASQQLGLTSNLLSGLQKGDETTSNLVSFSINAQNALSTDQLPEDIGNVVGSLINLKV